MSTNRVCKSRYYYKYISPSVKQQTKPPIILRFIEVTNKLEFNIDLLLNYYKKNN